MVDYLVRWHEVKDGKFTFGFGLNSKFSRYHKVGSGSDILFDMGDKF